IDYRVRVNGLPLSWRTVIEKFEPGVVFVDAQYRGPYRCWWHEHHFTAQGSKTLMEDKVYYAVPFGVLGKIANAFLIKGQLKQIFGYRKNVSNLRFARGGAAEGDAAEHAKRLA